MSMGRTNAHNKKEDRCKHHNPRIKRNLNKKKIQRMTQIFKCLQDGKRQDNLHTGSKNDSF